MAGWHCHHGNEDKSTLWRRLNHDKNLRDSSLFPSPSVHGHVAYVKAHREGGGLSGVGCVLHPSMSPSLPSHSFHLISPPSHRSWSPARRASPIPGTSPQTARLERRRGGERGREGGRERRREGGQGGREGGREGGGQGGMEGRRVGRRESRPVLRHQRQELREPAVVLHSPPSLLPRWGPCLAPFTPPGGTPLGLHSAQVV